MYVFLCLKTGILGTCPVTLVSSKTEEGESMIKETDVGLCYPRPFSTKLRRNLVQQSTMVFHIVLYRLLCFIFIRCRNQLLTLVG